MQLDRSSIVALPSAQTHEGPDETLARLARVKAALAAHGIPIPPGSRLARFEVLARQFHAKVVSPAFGLSREVTELLEAYRDFSEFATIVEHLLPAQPPAEPLLLEKVRQVLGGAHLPGEDANPAARDLQFELYVAARCRVAGIKTQICEPDCIIVSAEQRLGVAAKRAKSAAHVRRLVREGGRQLRAAGLKGIVALSFDRLVEPLDVPFVRPSFEQLVPRRS